MSSPACPLCGSALVKKGKKWYCPSCDRFWYVCRYCGEVFEGQRSLAAHMRVHRRDRAIKQADIVFEYARKIGLTLGDGYRGMVVELVERGLEPGEAASIALALFLYTRQASVKPKPQVREPREVRVSDGKSVPEDGGIAEDRDDDQEGLPDFARGNPWLKALSGGR